MFALGFYCREEDGYDEDSWSVEQITDDFGEAIDNLFEARNWAAEGSDLWEGSQLLLWVIRDGVADWEYLADGTFAQ